eukprot:Plantae.Rhodophyta-Purpureofilum_apyrenoidigerum.ctg19760.p1 GENE.Plantae.Rhodophyta-Purpureofilum_apyrenoidigerum.ctg19760~~Plantae.Rhodophyta-Purpureofilum_apyrenoidigerum.ctg19760.p1  ORF type:complete len:191 (-),score=54.11 Plantae.Rhodophyta-Purpureofilum_apyrenoidigerum.ctg19760:122-670(-)
MEEDKRVAKELVKAGKKDRALLPMKKYKLSEKRLANAEAMLFKVEQQLSTAEEATMTKELTENLEKTTQMVAELQKTIDIENVSRLLEENEEQRMAIQEVQNVLAGVEDPELEAEARKEYEQLLVDDVSNSAASQAVASEPQIQTEETGEGGAEPAVQDPQPAHTAKQQAPRGENEREPVAA